MKLATAAGIQFHPQYTTVVRENQNTYVGKAYGAVRLPDGTFKTHMETKRICLNDEEAKYRLEFMDKSIMGIHDWRSAKSAAEMFKGEWKEDPEKLNQWNKPEKYYVIADCDREKYIERSMLVNMTLLRKTASEKAQTGAILRVIRALLGIKGTYQLQELKKPFAVPTVTFSPDYSDASVRQAMLQQGMNSMGNMFGATSAIMRLSMNPLIQRKIWITQLLLLTGLQMKIVTQKTSFRHRQSMKRLNRYRQHSLHRRRNKAGISAMNAAHQSMKRCMGIL